jgi:hypothetical protein
MILKRTAIIFLTLGSPTVTAAMCAPPALTVNNAAFCAFQVRKIISANSEHFL